MPSLSLEDCRQSRFARAASPRFAMAHQEYDYETDGKFRHGEVAVQHEQREDHDDFEDQHFTVYGPIKSACEQDADEGGSQTTSSVFLPDHHRCTERLTRRNHSEGRRPRIAVPVALYTALINSHCFPNRIPTHPSAH
jgi:hypothetical protein